jgi:hypothetical protein
MSLSLKEEHYRESRSGKTNIHGFGIIFAIFMEGKEKFLIGLIFQSFAARLEPAERNK